MKFLANAGIGNTEIGQMHVLWMKNGLGSSSTKGIPKLRSECRALAEPEIVGRDYSATPMRREQ
jgi:hypothetical protein